MKHLLVALIALSTVSTACASESKLKLDESSREVAQSDEGQIVEVERPESLKGDSPTYKKHKEFLKYIDRHDRR